MLPIFLEGDLSVSKNFSVAASNVSDKTKAFLLSKTCPKCSNETPSAKNSPRESQRK